MIIEFYILSEPVFLKKKNEIKNLKSAKGSWKKDQPQIEEKLSNSTVKLARHDFV